MIKGGGGGAGVSVIMTLIFSQIVWMWPLTEHCAVTAFYLLADGTKIALGTEFVDECMQTRNKS